MKAFMAFVEEVLSVFFKKPTPAPVPTPVPVPPNPDPKPMPPPETPGFHLYKVANSFVGRDASPADIAPDEYACAESVSNIIHEAFGDFPKNSPVLSTAVLHIQLLNHPKFKGVMAPEPGDVIISPTGSGNGKLPNGHTGIFGFGGQIMSNDSATGLFKPNYTLDSWVARYRKLGGFKIYIFRRIAA